MLVNNTWPENNIFKFATKELSQDAFFAWLIYGWNYGGEGRKVAVAFLNLLYGYGKDTQHVLDFDKIDDASGDEFAVYVQTQCKEMDVLAVFSVEGEKHVLILEDKTRTSEHDNQINRYVHTILACTSSSEGDSGENLTARNKLLVGVKAKNIHVAYVKVDYWNDFDKKLVKNPVVIKTDGKDDPNSLVYITGVNARNLESLIVNMGLNKLSIAGVEASLIRSYSKYLENNYIEPDKLIQQTAESLLSFKTDLNNKPFNNGATEYYVLNRIFPNRKGVIYQGSSSGRPWSNYGFWSQDKMVTLNNEAKTDAFMSRTLFWRVDSDHFGKYLVLRQYENLKVAIVDSEIQKNISPDDLRTEIALKNNAYRVMQQVLHDQHIESENDNWSSSPEYADEVAKLRKFMTRKEFFDKAWKNAKIGLNATKLDGLNINVSKKDAFIAADILSKQSLHRLGHKGTTNESTLIRYGYSRITTKNNEQQEQFDVYAGIYLITAEMQIIADHFWNANRAENDHSAW